MTGLVECRSESEYAGRPVAVSWLGERLQVVEILNSWRDPSGKCFRVRLQNNLVVDLFYDEADDAWRLVEG